MEENIILLQPFVSSLIDRDKKIEADLKSVNQDIQFLLATFKTKKSRNTIEFMKRMHFTETNGIMQIGKREMLHEIIDTLIKSTESQ